MAAITAPPMDFEFTSAPFFMFVARGAGRFSAPGLRDYASGDRPLSTRARRATGSAGPRLGLIAVDAALVEEVRLSGPTTYPARKTVGARLGARHGARDACRAHGFG